MPTLDQLNVGQRGRIEAIAGSDNLLQRLLEMGLLEGEELELDGEELAPPPELPPPGCAAAAGRMPAARATATKANGTIVLMATSAQRSCATARWRRPSGASRLRTKRSTRRCPMADLEREMAEAREQMERPWSDERIDRVAGTGFAAAEADRDHCGHGFSNVH